MLFSYRSSRLLLVVGRVMAIHCVFVACMFLGTLPVWASDEFNSSQTDGVGKASSAVTADGFDDVTEYIQSLSSEGGMGWLWPGVLMVVVLAAGGYVLHGRNAN